MFLDDLLENLFYCLLVLSISLVLFNIVAKANNDYVDRKNLENSNICSSLGGVYLRGNCYKSGYEEESIYLEDYYKEVK